MFAIGIETKITPTPSNHTHNAKFSPSQVYLNVFRRQKQGQGYLQNKTKNKQKKSIFTSPCNKHSTKLKMHHKLFDLHGA